MKRLLAVTIALGLCAAFGATADAGNPAPRPSGEGLARFADGSPRSAGAVESTSSPRYPSAAASTVGARVVVCPAGDSLFLVIARQADGYPWYFSDVVVSFCGCPEFKRSLSTSDCAAQLDSCRVSAYPDPYGVVQFPIAGGGPCPGGSVEVKAGGIVLAVRGEPACFDQNGDLVVDQEDMDIVTSKLGSTDPSADFDGDGKVTKADRLILHRHLGHASATAPARGPVAR